MSGSKCVPGLKKGLSPLLLSALKVDQVFIRLERVIDDWAVRGAVDHLPHPAFDRAAAALQMGEVAAGAAIHLVFDFLRYPPETEVGKVVPLEVFAEPLVLGELLRAEAINLHQVCNRLRHRLISE